MFPYIQNYLVNSYILDVHCTSNTAYHLYVQCIAFDQGIYEVKSNAAS